MKCQTSTVLEVESFLTVALDFDLWLVYGVCRILFSFRTGIEKVDLQRGLQSNYHHQWLNVTMTMSHRNYHAFWTFENSISDSVVRTVLTAILTASIKYCFAKFSNGNELLLLLLCTAYASTLELFCLEPPQKYPLLFCSLFQFHFNSFHRHWDQFTFKLNGILWKCAFYV